MIGFPRTSYVQVRMSIWQQILGSSPDATRLRDRKEWGTAPPNPGILEAARFPLLPTEPLSHRATLPASLLRPAGSAEISSILRAFRCSPSSQRCAAPSSATGTRTTALFAPCCFCLKPLKRVPPTSLTARQRAPRTRQLDL